MENINFRLEELIEDRKINKEQLSKTMNLSSSSQVSAWTKGKRIPRLNYSLQLCEIFECSLDYLYGRSQDFSKPNFKKLNPFNKQIRKILQEKNVKQQTLVNETSSSFGSLASWFKENSNPNMTTLIDLADYLNVSLDYLAGRE